MTRVKKNNKYYVSIGVKDFIDTQLHFWKILSEKSKIFKS